jgi:hypothetical protein
VLARGDFCFEQNAIEKSPVVTLNASPATHCAIHGDIHTSCARAGCSGAVPENEKQEFKLSGESLSGFGDQVLCPKLVRSAVSVSLCLYIYPACSECIRQCRARGQGQCRRQTLRMLLYTYMYISVCGADDGSRPSVLRVCTFLISLCRESCKKLVSRPLSRVLKRN